MTVGWRKLPLRLDGPPNSNDSQPRKLCHVAVLQACFSALTFYQLINATHARNASNVTWGLYVLLTQASFRITSDKLLKQHKLVVRSQAKPRQCTQFSRVERVTGRCASMSVAIRPASLSAHSMFATIAQIAHSGASNTVAPLYNQGRPLGRVEPMATVVTLDHARRPVIGTRRATTRQVLQGAPQKCPPRGGEW